MGKTACPAEDDAKIAIEHQDLGLPGLAGKGYDIPGIDAANKQRYIDSCGLRLVEEFGEVSNRKQLEKMQQARDYARSITELSLLRARKILHTGNKE